MKLVILTMLGVALVSGRGLEPGDLCGQDSLLDPNSLLGMIKTSLAPWIPYDLHRMVAKYSMGDHVDWQALESYNIPVTEVRRDVEHLLTELMDHFHEMVEHYSQPPIQPYQHWQLFRAPDNVNDLWLTEVSLASDYIVHYIDKINIALNGGIFSEESNRFRQYSSAADERKLGLLKFLSKAINEIPVYEKEFFDLIKMARDEGFQKSFYSNLEESLEAQVDCAYSRMSSLNLTLYNTFMATVPKEKLVTYVLEFVPEAFKVINSIEAEFNMKKLIETVKKTLKDYNYNTLTKKALWAFLEARSLVLGVDIHQIFYRLDHVHNVLGEGWWKVSTGQWPEMLQFLTKFVDKTVKSDRFWAKVQEVYLEVVSNARQQYRDREELLEEAIKAHILPFLRNLLDQLQMTRTKDSSLVTNLIRGIEENQHHLATPGQLFDWLAAHLSRHVLSCYTKLYGKPDFDQLASMAATNPIVGFLKSVVVADWPEEQEVPEGFPEFVEQVQEMVLLILTSALGSCSDPMAG